MRSFLMKQPDSCYVVCYETDSLCTNLSDPTCLLVKTLGWKHWQRECRAAQRPERAESVGAYGSPGGPGSHQRLSLIS